MKSGTEFETAEVHRLIAEFDGRRPHASRTWPQQVQTEVENLPQAVQLALSNGWLAERDGRLSLTTSGAELARRSRAGPHRKRVNF